jgi:hypothetical protein
MSLIISNNATSRLVSAITNTATSISVTGGTGLKFPSTSGGDTFHVSLVDSSNNIEIVKVTSRVGDVFTVVRGQETTVPRAFGVGDRVAMTLTAEAFNSKADATEVTAEIAAAVNAHTSDTVDAHDASAISYAGGTGLSATDVEGALDELANEKLDKAGGVMTGDITMQAASIIEAEGASVAAAATTDIWATDGNTRHVTGNTTITSFGTAPQAGARMKIIFDGTPILTQSSNLEINGGGSNIQIEIGDWAEVYADTTTQFDVTVHRKSGQPIVTTDPRLGLTNYEGVNITAGLTYLTSSQSVGAVVDGKLGTVAITLSFTNAASVIESILDFGASSFFNISRTASGNIAITAKNAAGTTIMSFTTSGNPCALAGRYTILASWNLAVPGSGRLYINNTSNYSEVTYTNDTIDYTHTSFNIGSLTGGASALTASVYVVYFNELQALDFNLKAERAKFIDEALNINFMGLEGALPSPTQQKPYIFLAYSYELFNGFLTPRGKSNIQSVSTRPAEAPVPISGAYDPSIDLYRGVTIAAKDFQINNTTTLVGIGDMAAAGVMSDFGFLAKPTVRYNVQIKGTYSSAATTVGARFVLKNIVTGNMAAKIEQTLTATTTLTNYVSGVDLPATASATSLLSGNIYNIEAFLTVTGSAAHIMAAFASEVAANDITLSVGFQMMTITKLR